MQKFIKDKKGSTSTVADPFSNPNANLNANPNPNQP